MKLHGGRKLHQDMRRTWAMRGCHSSEGSRRIARCKKCLRIKFCLAVNKRMLCQECRT